MVGIHLRSILFPLDNFSSLVYLKTNFTKVIHNIQVNFIDLMHSIDFVRIALVFRL